MDSLWASRHRAYVKIAAGSVAAVVLLIILFNIWYEPPTCFDRKQNQDELGVDCGGQCALYCSAQMKSVDVEWTKTFPITEGVWSAVALVQHSNLNARSTLTPYRFTFYDVDGKLIGTRTGQNFFSSDDKRVFPIIEPKVDLGERTPYRTMFEWLEEPTWYRYTPLSSERVKVEEREIVKLNYGVEIRAWLRNDLPEPLQNIEVAVVLTDLSNNAIAVSTTFVDSVPARSGVPISFSWPEYFVKNLTRTAFYYRIKNPEQYVR